MSRGVVAVIYKKIVIFVAMLDVEILIPTVDNLGRVTHMSLPRLEGVRYVVRCQGAHGDVPESLRREDVSLMWGEDRGLSVNRNVLLSASSATIVMFIDDDIELRPEALYKVLNYLDADPELDYVAFNCRSNSHDTGSERCLDLCDGKMRYFTMYSMVIRRRAIDTIRFSVLAGVGAPFLKSGEDDLFYYQMVSRGLRGVYLPVTATAHPGESTGDRRQTPGVLRGRGGVLHMVYPCTSLLHIIYVAARVKGLGFFKNIKYMLQGRRYAARYHRELLFLDAFDG